MSDWPDHIAYDITLEALHERMNRLYYILVERGGFKYMDAKNILTGLDQTGIENVAKWLRQEIAQLREVEKLGEAAPVRRGLTMSPADISDLAVTLLEALLDQSEPELIALIAELLNVDKHRRDKAQRSKKEEMGNAAFIEAQIEGLSNRDLAKEVGVDHTTISRWRKNPDYKKRVEFVKSVLAMPDIKDVPERWKSKKD